MKKFLCLAATGMFLFSACSNDGDPKDDLSQGSPVGQELVLRVANTGDGLTTKAGRPLYSSEAAQTIDKVKVAIFSLGASDAITGCVYDKEYAQWSDASSPSGIIYNGSTYDGSADHGRYATLNLKTEITSGANTGLDPGSYLVYAVGYTSSGSNYTHAPALTDIAKGWSGASTFNHVTSTTAGEGEEIFAGSIQKITVDNNRNFALTANVANNVLYLHRQVAGVFGYFKNIPAKVDNKDAVKLRLVSSGKNTQLDMTNFNSSFRKTGGANVKYVVNGKTPATATAKFHNSTGANDTAVLYEINLSDWFKGTPMDVNDDGLLNDQDAGTEIAPTWVIPAAMSADFNAKKGTVFACNFVIPFANQNKNTLELQLLDNSNTIIKYWTVNLAAAQANVVQIDNSTIPNESTSSYSLVRNHLYSIGEKTIAKPSNPETPGGGEVEEPEDLFKGQIITLRVNDNWELIHKLVVE